MCCICGAGVHNKHTHTHTHQRVRARVWLFACKVEFSNIGRPLHVAALNEALPAITFSSIVPYRRRHRLEQRGRHTDQRTGCDLCGMPLDIWSADELMTNPFAVVPQSMRHCVVLLSRWKQSFLLLIDMPCANDPQCYRELIFHNYELVGSVLIVYICNIYINIFIGYVLKM